MHWLSRFSTQRCHEIDGFLVVKYTMYAMMHAPIQPLCITLHRDPSISNLRYDTSTVIDLVHSADLYLWGGAGFSSGKVSYLWTQRDEMFKGRRHRLDNLDTFQSISNFKLRSNLITVLSFFLKNEIKHVFTSTLDNLDTPYPSSKCFFKWCIGTYQMDPPFERGSHSTRLWGL